MQDQIEVIGMLIIKGLVLPLVGLFVAWASAKLPALISAHVKNTGVAGVLARLSTLAWSVVAEVEQTVVSKLGDKADATTLAAARDQAIATLKSHLGEKGLKEIEDVLGLKDQDAVTKLLITFIESAVHGLPKPGQLLETIATAPAVIAPAIVVTPATP